MRSILTVTTAPTVTRLTTLDRIKAELNITGTANDVLLGAKLDEATSDIEAHLGGTLSRAAVSETMWAALGENSWTEYLTLERWPVASIASVTVDGVVLDSTLYRLDPDTGLLYRLDPAGFPCIWIWCKAIVVAYSGGYLLPGESGRNLPRVLEAACVDLMLAYWTNRGRDPLIKTEDVPGLGRVEYWVGAVGESGELPPSVTAKIAPYRRPSI